MTGSLQVNYPNHRHNLQAECTALKYYITRMSRQQNLYRCLNKFIHLEYKKTFQEQVTYLAM